jgi:hypothetical protein
MVRGRCGSKPPSGKPELHRNTIDQNAPSANPGIGVADENQKRGDVVDGGSVPDGF